MRFALSLPLLILVFAEIAVYVIVGGAIGIVPTLLLTIASMLAGVALLRRQGLGALNRLRTPGPTSGGAFETIAEGAVLALAAMLMMLPGLITSAIGLMLFVPPIRRAVLRRGRYWTQSASVRAAPRPGGVVELGPEDYSAPPRPDSPWRQEG